MKGNTQSGAVFYYILLAVALVAALSYVVSQGNRGGVSKLSEDQARIIATEIIEYANALTNAVQKLRLRGCSDIEISFENPIVTNYVNPNSPADKSCHVFDLAGGALNWVDHEVFGGTLSGFPNDACISGVGTGSLGTACQSDGTGDTDLMYGLEEIDIRTCEKINDILGIDSIIVDAGQPPNLTIEFIGTYAEGSSITNSASNLDVMPVMSCVTPASLPANRYYFYAVVLAR